MSEHKDRLNALRAELKSRKLDGFVLPLTDEHMSEYVGAYAGRLDYITGFTGSAGNGVVLLDKAAVFIDGRYTIQAAAELDPALFEHHLFTKLPLLKWTTDNLPKGARLGYDPELATVGWEDAARKACARKGIELVAVDGNPVDAVWTDQPSEPMAPAVAHDSKYAGQDARDKRTKVAAELKEAGADAAVITMLDSVAWAFNIRGKDVMNTPVTHAFAIMNADETATLFINEQKVSSELKQHLGNSVQVEPREAFYETLATLGADGKAVLVDPATNNAKVFKTLRDAGAKLVEGADPCILPKAVKNTTEQQGARDCHIRDGAAVSEFLHWISVEAPKGTVDELKAVQKLWECRESHGGLKDKSFDTISGAGPNGAIVHYRATKKTNRPLKMDEIFLVDSGGQYLDGTTDITRTVIVGTPTAEMKDRFTRVLKGHIALSTVRFPAGTPGMALDAMARRPLWAIGCDYDHGTGHGVGSFLAVHEGPQRIAKYSSDIWLEPGMILSNEPGYYKEGEYGIRIENLILVKKVDEDTEREVFEFENLTWVPIDRNLIEPTLLDDVELKWLNDYHARVFELVSPHVDDATRDWLQVQTAPIMVM
ncbi:aminopeptidase P family protein [Kordiimonas aestuarii]|uniref:aminopeptidase P family protein n=1 Tax=Kordiimonas aestuarii TaxID=1005925 RepID=UPI0021D16E52|nr:aminopeptidase P family protein [Kordiimonas aestuarii]